MIQHFPVLSPEESVALILEDLLAHPGLDVEHTLWCYNPSEVIKEKIREKLREAGRLAR